MTLEYFGSEGGPSPAHYVLELATLGELPADLSALGPNFACLVAADTRGVPTVEIGRFALSLLESGAAYICAWGEDCERVHDVFDEEWVGDGTQPDRFGAGIMTTWHSEETFDDALAFLLLDARRGAIRNSVPSVVIVVGLPECARRAREVLADPQPFVRDRA